MLIEDLSCQHQNQKNATDGGKRPFNQISTTDLTAWRHHWSLQYSPAQSMTRPCLLMAELAPSHIQRMVTTATPTASPSLEINSPVPTPRFYTSKTMATPTSTPPILAHWRKNLTHNLWNTAQISKRGWPSRMVKPQVCHILRLDIIVMTLTEIKKIKVRCLFI